MRNRLFPVLAAAGVVAMLGFAAPVQAQDQPKNQPKNQAPIQAQDQAKGQANDQPNDQAKAKEQAKNQDQDQAKDEAQVQPRPCPMGDHGPGYGMRGSYHHGYMRGPGYGYGPGYGMMGGYGHRWMGGPDDEQGWMCRHGYGPGWRMGRNPHGYMMGPSYGGGYHQGQMMGPGYGPGYRGGYHQGQMMGSGYGPGYGGGYHQGQMMGSGYGRGPGYGSYHSQGDLQLSVDDVKAYLARMIRNPNLKVGDVKEKDDDTITADVVTKDNSLVRRFEVNRHSGFYQPEQ